MKTQMLISMILSVAGFSMQAHAGVNLTGNIICSYSNAPVPVNADEKGVMQITLSPDMNFAYAQNAGVATTDSAEGIMDPSQMIDAEHSNGGTFMTLKRIGVSHYVILNIGQIQNQELVVDTTAQSEIARPLESNGIVLLNAKQLTNDVSCHLELAD